MRARGFTLVEVMVALAIVAITLPALLMALYQQVDDAAYLRDKTLAEMVAVNKLTEMRLVVASTRNLKAGKDSGEKEFVDRDWYWWTETTATEAGKVFRVDISVALSEERREQPLFKLTASLFGDLAVDPDGLPEESGGDTGSGSDTGTGSTGSDTPPESIEDLGESLGIEG
ncbi:MAG: type II secretion system minor pseudopilin GspI [Halioglobus sp.]|nr:type II secretion system minor pseudopilin GspI [Halioglobus sp.]